MCPLPSPAADAALLSPLSRDRLRALHDALARGETVEELRDELADVARGAATDARRSGKAAEQLVIALRQEWRSMGRPANVPSEALEDAASRLVTTAIAEFYRGQ
jgi:hypothetical protein